MEQQTRNYWISEREQEDDRSSDDMEKDNTARRSSVDKETEQDYLELTGGEMEPAYLLKRKIEEAVEPNLKARTPSRRTEKYQRSSEEQQWMKGGQQQRPSKEQQWMAGGQQQRPSEEQQWMEGGQRQRPLKEQQWMEGGKQHRPSEEQQWMKREQQQRPSEEQQ